MAAKQRSALAEALAEVPDPRRQCRNLRHRLVDILVIGFCAVLCGCEDFVEIEEFGRSKEAFFRCFLELPEGIASHDTFRRVFQAVCPLALQQCLLHWLLAWRQSTQAAGEDNVVAIDGKTLRRTFDRRSGLHALHLVSAWATANGISLGQVAVDAKSNEITAIPHLLDLLDLKDCVVTIDAAGCQKEIAAQIVAKEADYVLAVKDNQPTLHQEIQAYFQEQFEAAAPDPKLRRHEETTHSHGRTEMRQTLVAPAPPALRASGVWVGLATILMVYRQSVDQVTGKITDEVRYFISSLPARARRLAGAVRQHWGIENSLHWVLDVAFHEDRMRQRDRTAIENLALLNRLAVSMLRQDKTVKAGVKCKRKRAGWDNDYLLHILCANP
jgi:predicted transposase YbfD/YdcC